MAATTQSAFAREIEAASRTAPDPVPETGVNASAGWSLYPSLVFRREMLVDGCDITARAIRTGADNADLGIASAISFDLARTQLPDSHLPLGQEVAFLAGKDGSRYGIAGFTLRFADGKRPNMLAFVADTEIADPVSGFTYLMEPVADVSETLRRVALLHRYKAGYYTFTN